MHKNINGDRALIAVERAINELRCGRAVYCRELNAGDAHPRGALLASAETASAALLSRMEQLAGGAGLALAMTRQRADALGLKGGRAPTDGQGDAVLLRLHHPVSPATVRVLAGMNASGVSGGLTPTVAPTMTGPFTDRSDAERSLREKFTPSLCDARTAAAVNLAKQARLLPAIVLVASPPPLAEDEILEISAPQLERFAGSSALDLEPVSEARVPLAGHEDCRLVLFRDGRDASEHIAVVIGSPGAADAVSVRLHSACLTGDLLGSLRCDCGDQLRGAVDQLAAADGGVLLYLAQEGRGIGLANKLRAYELQDAGLDTIEADRRLGFRADERSYAAAASMLRHLGLTRIRLLTNNLEKIEALRKEGIEVVAGQRLLGAVNRHNVRYIRAKRERAGHLMPEIKVEGT